MRILSLLTLAALSLSAVPSAQFLQEFEAYAEGERKAWGVPGMAIAIVSEDKILYEKGFGARGLDDKRPVTKDTLFQIGSLTKAFTAALVAMGVEERRFEWTTPVQEVMADFQLADSWVSRQFQMQDLLAQRSGLPSYAGDNQSILGFDREQIYRHMVHLKPVTSFRAAFAYQNVFFLAAARALEKSGMGGYEALLEERIFKPLGMTNSSATLKAYQENENSAEWSLRREDGTWLNLGRSYPYEEWNYTYGAAGGINSSVHDMAKWTLFQANLGTFNGKRLISEENMRMMHRPFIFAGERNSLSVYYALGWLHVENSPYPIICHDGATMGVFNALGVIPQERLGIVILTNGRETQLALALMFDFFNRFYKKEAPSMSRQMLAAVKKSSPPERGMALQPLEAYAGTYSNAIYGDAVVSIKEDHLLLTLGPKKAEMTLTPLAASSFTLHWPIMDESESKVVFCLDAEGNPSVMNIEMISKEGSGYFERK